MSYSIAPESLLGKPIDSPEVIDFCDEFGFSPIFELVGNARHCEAPDSGLDITCDDDERVNAVFMFSRPHGENKNVSRYDGILPPQVHFSMSREEALDTFGKAVASGNAESFLGMQIAAWDKFDIGDYLLHLQYNESVSGIDQVSVFTKEAMLKNRLEG